MNKEKTYFTAPDLDVVDVVAMLKTQGDAEQLPLAFPVDRCWMSADLLQGIRDKDATAIDYIQAVVAAKAYRAIATAQECLAPGKDLIELAEHYSLMVLDREQESVLATVDYANLCVKLRELDLGF